MSRTYLITIASLMVVALFLHILLIMKMHWQLFLLQVIDK
jgi:hypothetical protein